MRLLCACVPDSREPKASNEIGRNWIYMTRQTSFETTMVVNFGDTDPAAIVYFPNIFHYCQIAFERFLPEAAQITYARMLADERIAFPTVEAKASFRKAIRYGESVRIRVEIGHLGDS